MFVKIQSVNSIWQVCAAADRAHRKQTAAASRRSPHSIFWQVLMSRWHKKHSTIHINHLIQTKSREELALCFTGCRLNLFSLTRRQKLDFYAPINDLHLHFIYIYIYLYILIFNTKYCWWAHDWMCGQLTVQMFPTDERYVAGSRPVT